MPAEGIFHNLVLVSIDKQYPGQAYKVMNGLWGQGLMSLAKVIVVLDKDVNVRDPKEAWWVALNHIDPNATYVHDGADRRADHSSRGFSFARSGDRRNQEGKEEGFTREWPNKIVMDADTGRRWTRCGRSWGLNSKGGGGRARAVEGGEVLSREGQTFAGESLFTRYVNFVRLPHTVFALPFALLGVVVASRDYPVTWRMLGLVVLAFTAARFVAMGFNRIADRGLDAKNPRTRARELPAGRLTLRQAWAAVVAAAAVFLWAAWALNPICFRLSPIALAVITLYSYSKRFTWWSHLWLGFGDAIAGPAGYLAVSGEWSEPWAAVGDGLGGDVLDRGFDIFYALQDEASIGPRDSTSAVYGSDGTGHLVGKCFTLAVLALIAFGIGAGLGIAYYAGVVVGAALIAYEHQLVKPGDLSRLDAAFFTMNGIVSIVVFLGALVDRVM